MLEIKGVKCSFNTKIYNQVIKGLCLSTKTGTRLIALKAGVMKGFLIQKKGSAACLKKKNFVFRTLIVR